MFFFLIGLRFYHAIDGILEDFPYQGIKPSTEQVHGSAKTCLSYRSWVCSWNSRASDIHAQQVPNERVLGRNDRRSLALRIRTLGCASGSATKIIDENFDQRPSSITLPGRKTFPDASPSLDEGRRRLVVDRSETGNVADKLVQQSWLKEIGFFRNQRLFSKDHVLGCSRVSGEQAPVDETTVT